MCFYGGVYAIFKLIWLNFIAVALASSTEFQHELSNKHTMLNGVRMRVYAFAIYFFNIFD